MRNLIVNKKYNNKKLSSFLMNEFPHLSINSIYKSLRKKDIIINGKRVSENIYLKENDDITIYICDDLLFSKINIEIIYEDDNILIINKPIGIEVVGNNSLTSIISNNYNYCAACHRLDRNTSGLLLYAKNEESKNILLDKFKTMEIEKHYIAKVYGIPKNKTSDLEAYLFKDNKKSLVYISDTFKKGYQKILTSYNLISKDVCNNTSILDITLHTGRTHQIRAHLAHIGHPIIGDGKYGINKTNKKFAAKTQALCAYKLKFNFKSDSGILNYLNNKEFKIDVYCIESTLGNLSPNAN